MREPGIVGLLVVLALACSGSEREQQAADEARAMADGLIAELSGRLLGEMQASGPAGAVRICSEVAQELTSARSEPSRSIRRVSLRPRNPVDAPDAFEREVLGRMAGRVEAGERPGEMTVVRKEEGRRVLRLMRPIFVAEPCLACHGARDVIPAEVQEHLARTYPDDRAVGYQAGDLRGAVTVRIALDGRPL